MRDDAAIKRLDAKFHAMYRDVPIGDDGAAEADTGADADHVPLDHPSLTKIPATEHDTEMADLKRGKIK